MTSALPGKPPKGLAQLYSSRHYSFSLGARSNGPKQRVNLMAYSYQLHGIELFLPACGVADAAQIFRTASA